MSDLNMRLYFMGKIKEHGFYTMKLDNIKEFRDRYLPGFPIENVRVVMYDSLNYLCKDNIIVKVYQREDVKPSIFTPNTDYKYWHI